MKTYISRTPQELEEHRQLAIRATQATDLSTFDTELEAKADAELIQESLERVEKAEIYIGIFGHRYGYIPQGESVSLTEMEYRHAVARNIPVLIFIEDSSNVIEEINDDETKTSEKLQKLKQDLMQNHIVGFFSSPNDLSRQIIQALSHSEFLSSHKASKEVAKPDWQRKAIGEVISVLYRYPTYYNISYIDAGVPEIRGELILDNGELDSKPEAYRYISENTASHFPRVRLDSGDFVMSVRGTLGKIGMVPPTLSGSVITANLIRIKFDDSQVSSNWAKHLLLWRQFQEQIDLVSSGTTIRTIQAPAFSSIKIDIPPLHEQRTIAHILETLDREIQETSAIIDKLQQVKIGLLDDLLTCGLDENGDLRDPERNPELFHRTKLGTLPKSWVIRNLAELVPANRPIVYGILMPGYGYNGGVPVIKVKDIKGGKIDQSNLLLTDPKIDEQYSRSRLKSGDLLFTIRGTVGRTAFVPDELANSNITQDTARITVSEADPSYINHYLQMPGPRRFIDLHISGQAVKGLNLRDLRRTPIALPTLDEQELISSKLDLQDERIQQEIDYEAKLQLLKQGLLEDLLTGRIRTKDIDAELDNLR